MTQETKREHLSARAEKPAPAGKTEQPKGRAGNEAALVELTDADLQAVSGGGSKPGVSPGIGV
jgi:hypothetical protein